MRVGLVGLNQNQVITDFNLWLSSLSGGIQISIIKKILILQNQILMEMIKALKNCMWLLFEYCEVLIRSVPFLPSPTYKELAKT